jgi:hypothetical protein
LTPHAALLEAAAEDVAVVNLLVWQCPSLWNIEAFSGQRPALESPGHLVAVNTTNVHERLGRLLLLNCHRVVYPLAAGGPEEPDDWTMADWCDQCHRKGGLVVGDGFFGNPGKLYGELPADVILGKVDALEMNDQLENAEINSRLNPDSILDDWYRLLDCGFRVPLVNGSGKDCNLVPLGSNRTYARLQPGEELTYKNWIEAVRAGRTFRPDRARPCRGAQPAAAGPTRSGRQPEGGRPRRRGRVAVVRRAGHRGAAAARRLADGPLLGAGRRPVGPVRRRPELAGVRHRRRAQPAP